MGNQRKKDKTRRIIAKDFNYTAGVGGVRTSVKNLVEPGSTRSNNIFVSQNPLYVDKLFNLELNDLKRLEFRTHKL